MALWHRVPVAPCTRGTVARMYPQYTFNGIFGFSVGLRPVEDTTPDHPGGQKLVVFSRFLAENGRFSAENGQFSAENGRFSAEIGQF